MKSRILVSLATLALFVGVSDVVRADSYSTSGVALTSVAATIPSEFDKITLSSVTGTIAGPGTYVLNLVQFDVGINSSYAYTYYPGTLAQTLTVGAVSQTLTMPFSLDINYSDTLSIFGGTTLYFPGLKLVVNALTLGPVGPFTGTQNGELTAQVSAVPLPAALPLFAGVLGLLGWMAKRRRKTEAVA